MSKRRRLDQYFTPESAVDALLAHVPILPTHTILEPCAGIGNIAAPLLIHGCDVWTNDIDPVMSADTHADASIGDFWLEAWRPDWIVSNPPFSKAAAIVTFSHQHAKLGVAMLLRLSFLEPCDDRATFLAEFPPTRLISVPRISFTGDGKTDMVATAWFVWEKEFRGISSIIVVPRAH